MNKVPSLRFKEFSGEWEEKSILEIVKDEKNSIKIGPFGSQLKKERFVEKSNFKVYGQENVINKDFSIGNRYMTESHFKELCTNEIKSGDFLISSMGTIGQSVIVPEKIEQGIMDSHLIRLRLKNEITNSKFIQQIFLLDKTQNKILSLSVGGIMAGLSIGIIKKLFFTLPNLEEQEKIGNFLSSVDKKISIMEEKLNLFNQYKKGIMQKIFNQELRFKNENGNNYPEWEEKKLGDLITSQGGRALEKYSNESGKYKFISIGNYSENSKFFDNGKRIDLNSETEKQLLNKNELVMILNDKTKTGNIIGRTLLIDENNMYIYNQRSQRIVCKKEFLPKFAYVLLNSSYRNNIIQNAQGGTQIYINFSTVENLILNLPCLEEQKKIADFLSAIDNKIENISDNLESLKLFKKSMLQKMFV